MFGKTTKWSVKLDDLQLTRPAPPLHRSGSRSCGAPGVLILTNAKGSIGWPGTPGGVCNNRHPSRPNPSGSTSTITIGISSVGCEKGSKWDNTSAPLVGWPGTPNPAKLWTKTAAAAATAHVHSRPSGSFQKGPQVRSALPCIWQKSLLTPTTNPRTTALVTLPTETKSPPGGDCSSSTASEERVFGLCLPHSCADSPPNETPASPYCKG
ncbi:hypothetical protein QR685DRAFT_574059 [Neurospora intermedia]|uniref:Uncharacterized protein n=1 Tax=Neurospora intermedia TaxID=5142 RepID=A0ABR3D6I0_NEUIN